MDNLSSLPNIGKTLALLLTQCGIKNSDELKGFGTEQVFIRLFAHCNDACFSKLMAIEGAIQGIRWHQIDPNRKQELKEFFFQLKKGNASAIKKQGPLQG